jgi:hypothetical protein
VAGIEQFFDLKTMAFDDAVGRLKAFEERTRWGAGSKKSGEPQLLLTQAEWEALYKKSGGRESSERGKVQDGGGRGRGRGHAGEGHGRRGRGDAPGGKDGAGHGRDKSHIKCFKCHTYGYYANKCLGVEQKREEAHHARAEVGQPQALMLAVIEELSPAAKQKVVMLDEERVSPELHFTGVGEQTGDVWYLDNGASNHMTGDRKKFTELDEGIMGKLRFGDGSTVEIEGKGSILFRCKDGDQWVLSGVYYIPKLQRNLVSLGQLTECGHRILMANDDSWRCLTRLEGDWS